MIGKISIGKSFGGCIRYCLQDKPELSEEDKLRLGRQDGLVYKNRAEILSYNKCFGNPKELIRQFNDLRSLRPRLSQPVMHVTLNFDKSDSLTQEKLRQISQDFAQEFGFVQNQWISIYHKDTHHPHVHIVANRIGFDGTCVSDSNSYKRIATISRNLEIKYGLKQVLSPQKFLSMKHRKEYGRTNRLDARKLRLRENIGYCLLQSIDFAHFNRLLKQSGITIIKGRGISFVDDKKMKVKGSDIGYSLATVEKILKQSLGKRSKLYIQLRQEYKFNNSIDKSLLASNPASGSNIHPENILGILLRPEQGNSFTPKELLQKKRKRKPGSLHL